MSIEKLESFLQTKSLYFCRSDRLGDNHEGSTTKPTINYRKIFYDGATEHYIKESVPYMQKLWGLCTYINCWHVDNNESNAMWNLYVKDGQGVAIKSSISNLKNSILNDKRTFCLGFINYLDFDKDYSSEANAFSPFFIKRDIFKHEQEFRILTDEVENINKIMKKEITPQDGIFIPIDFQMVEKMVLSPNITKTNREKVEILMKQLKIPIVPENSAIPRIPEF
jgi:hypothetical protein